MRYAVSLLAAVLLSNTFAESCAAQGYTTTVTQSPPVAGKTPFHFRISGGSQNDTFVLRVQKITGYDSGGPIYGAVTGFAMEPKFVEIPGGQTYTGHEKAINDFFETGSGTYRVQFRKELPTPTVVATVLVVP